MSTNNHLYNNQEQRWDTVIGHVEFLGKIRRARDLYEQTNAYDVDLFVQWLREEYGVDIIQNQDGLTADYTVVDEQKFLLFELKFTI